MDQNYDDDEGSYGEYYENEDTGQAGEKSDSYGSFKDDEIDKQEKQAQNMDDNIFDPEDDIIDYLLSEGSDLKADELLRNVENMILNKEESTSIYPRIAKLFNYIGRRLEMFVGLKDPLAFQESFEEVIPFIKLLINAYAAIRYTQFSFFCLKPQYKLRLKASQNLFNNLLYFLSKKSQDFPLLEKSLTQFLEFATCPSDSFALSITKPADAIINYLVENIYESPKKSFFRFLALAFFFLPNKAILRFCEELLLPSKVMIESALQLDVSEEKKENMMFIEDMNLEQEELNYEILKFLVITGFNSKARKMLVSEKTYHTLYLLLRNSYSIFTPKKLRVSHKNSTLMLQLIDNLLVDLDDYELTEFAEGVYNDIMYSIDKNELKYISNVISPLISAPIFSFLPICLHFDDDIDNIIQDLKSNKPDIVLTKNLLNEKAFNSQLLTSQERDLLLNKIQNISLTPKSKKLNPKLITNYEWKRILEINFEKPFGGDPNTINKELSSADGVIFIFQCLIGEEIAKIGVYSNSKMIKNTGAGLRVNQEDDNFMFYYSNFYKLHFLSNELTKNVGFDQAYGGYGGDMNNPTSIFNSMKSKDKKPCLEYNDNSVSVYYGDKKVISYIPQSPDTSTLNFDISYMWSLEERNGKGMKVFPLDPSTFCCIQAIEAWVGSSVGEKVNQNVAVQEVLLNELKDNVKYIYMDAFQVLREGKPVYLAPRDMTIGAFLGTIFNSGEIIVPEFTLRCLGDQKIDLTVGIEKLSSLIEAGDHPQILDLFIYSPLGAKEVKKNLHPSEQIYESIFEHLSRGNERFSRFLMTSDRLQQFFRKVSLSIIKNNSEFLETYTILAEEIEVFSTINTYGKYLTEGGEFFNYLFQLLDASQKRQRNKTLILKLSYTMYRALGEVFRGSDLSFLVDFNLPNFVHILLKKIEFLDREMETAPRQETEENPFAGNANPKDKSMKNIAMQSLFSLNNPVADPVPVKKEDAYKLQEQHYQQEKLMNEIMNNVFLCLTKLMENQMPDDFYEQCAEKIKTFKFVKVISKMLNFLNFSEPGSVKLQMQIELLRLLEMWAQHEGLTHIFWEDVQDFGVGINDKYTFYQRLLGLIEQIKIGSIGVSNEEDPKIKTIKNQMLKLLTQIDADLQKFYVITITEQTSDITKSLALPLSEAYPKCLKPYCVDSGYIKNPSSGKWEHHYTSSFSSSSNPSSAKLERVIKELNDLTNSLPMSATNAIFVRYDQTRMDVMKALIMGSAETPYAHGAFEFDIFIGDNYPNGPPTVNLMTTGRGTVRFNPNLYACGKVCLSLLGTWRGNANENWNPKFSTILQVLISIQSIIMTEDVYYNEPGFENSKKTTEGQHLNEGYSNIVKYANIRHAMIDAINNPPRCFKEPILIHFYLKKDMILTEVNKWLEEAKNTQGKYTGLVSSHNHALAAKFGTSKAYADELKKAIDDLKKTLAGLNLTIEKTFKIRTVDWKRKAIKKQDKQKDNENYFVDVNQIDVAYDEKVEHKEIDIKDEKVTNRWSRYIGAMGIEAVEKQAHSSILLLGLNALGVEIAKNIVLSGVKRFTICDSKKVEASDLSGQFFLNESDINNYRAEASLNKLQALNQYVQLDLIKDEITEKNLEKLRVENYSAVIYCEGTLELGLNLNKYCRSTGVLFILAQTRGLFSRVFCDFGPSFQVVDKTGEEQVDLIVKEITKEGLLTLLDGSKHNLQDNDQITFTKAEEEGDGQSFKDTMHKIRINNKQSFFIGDVSGFKTLKSGIVRTMKGQAVLNFKPLAECLDIPPLDESISAGDFWADTKYKFLHYAFIKAEEYLAKKKLNTFKKPVDKSICDQLLKETLDTLKAKAPAALENLNQQKELIGCLEWINLLVATWDGTFPSLCAFLGGVVAQEAIKGVTRKYVPLKQFFYYECSELVANNLKAIMTQQPKMDKYYALKVCLGEELFEALANARLFMVGAGAIGCELLKNYAMIGLGSNKGKIVLTDPDVIENSNLNRQFLFREKHLRKPKASTAAAVVMQMNPDLKDKIYPMLEKIHDQTENIFTNKFFEGLDVVTNALDNIHARKYVDSRCVKSRIPLIESGTLGPKGHVQVIVPFKTESYGSQQDPQEDNEIPYCTLKMFPEETLHCIEWGRDKFNKMFTQKPTSFTKTIEAVLGNNTETLEDKILSDALNFAKTMPKSFDDCLQWARNKFQKLFIHDIKQLLYTYPLDFKTENGNPFWSLPKRPPQDINFDPSNPIHTVFVTACACLRATVCGIPIPNSPRSTQTQYQLAKVASSLKPKEYKISDKKAQELKDQNNKAATSENTNNNNNQNMDIELKSKSQMLSELLNVLKVKDPQELKKFKVFAQEFEKDEDDNFHIDFLFAMTNCRAANYKLDAMDWITVKLKAGRIIPALATTTAAIAGLQTIELCKLMSKCIVEQHKNSFLNLSVPILAQSEPSSAPVYQLREGLKVNLWDRWDVDLRKIQEVKSLKDLLEHLKKETGLEPLDVLKGNQPIYLHTLMSLPMKAKEKELTLNRRLEDNLDLAGDEEYVDLTITFTSEKAMKENPKDPILKGTPPVRLHLNY